MPPKAVDEEEQARVRAMLQAKLNAPADSPQEATAKFFRSFFADSSWKEAQEDISSQSAENPRSVLAGLAGVEGLLAHPPTEPGVLLDLVLWDANTGLENPSDESAMVWMREVAEMVREVLGDKQPPRPETGEPETG